MSAIHQTGMTFLETETSVLVEPAANDEMFGIPYEFLRVNEGQETEDLEVMLDAAVSMIETWTRQTIRKTTFTVKYPGYYLDGKRHGLRPFLIIEKMPFIQTVELRVLLDGEEDFTVVQHEDVVQPVYSRVFFPKDFDVNTVEDSEIHPIEIDFIAGWSLGTVVSPDKRVPAAIKLAIKQTMAHLYENRGDFDVSAGLPELVKATLSTLKIPNFL